MGLTEEVDRSWGKGLRDEYGAFYSPDAKELMRGPRPNVKEYVVREGTERLCWCAFKDNFHITSVKFPDSLVSLGSWTFENCNGLTSIEVPRGVTQLEERVFKNCKNLHTIKLPAHITSIGQQAFELCENLYSIVFIDALPNREHDSSHDDCEREILFDRLLGGEVKLPEGLVSIGHAAFYGCERIRTIVLPSTLCEMDRNPFCGCRAHIENNSPYIKNGQWTKYARW